MKLGVYWSVLGVFLLGSIGAEAQQKKRKSTYPPNLPEATAEVYKTVGDVNLKLYLFTPEGHTVKTKRAAVVFFFGGGWKSGSPAQFHEQAKYMAKHGAIAVCADYRVASRHGVKATACVEDAKSAVRWLRVNADRLGIDPNRIIAAGGSAGGHIAAATGTVKGFEAEGEDLTVSSVPNAMVLFNPACVLAPVDGVHPLDPEKVQGLPERMGTDPIHLSPYHHVSKNTPPTLLFHGKADTTVPYRTAEQFAAAMKKAKVYCDLVGFDDMPHGFFNYGRFDNKPFEQSMTQMVTFFVVVGMFPM